MPGDDGKVLILSHQAADATPLMQALRQVVANERLQLYTDPVRFLLEVGSHVPHPALAVINLHVPPLDGIEVIRAARRAWSDSPIIALGRGAHPLHAGKATKAGATAHLAGPTDQDGYAAIVRYLLDG